MGHKIRKSWNGEYTECYCSICKLTWQQGDEDAPLCTGLPVSPARAVEATAQGKQISVSPVISARDILQTLD